MLVIFNSLLNGNRKKRRFVSQLLGFSSICFYCVQKIRLLDSVRPICSFQKIRFMDSNWKKKKKKGSILFILFCKDSSTNPTSLSIEHCFFWVPPFFTINNFKLLILILTNTFDFNSHKYFCVQK
jgi:hypothetical protein